MQEALVRIPIKMVWLGLLLLEVEVVVLLEAHLQTQQVLVETVAVGL